MGLSETMIDILRSENITVAPAVLTDAGAADVLLLPIPCFHHGSTDHHTRVICTRDAETQVARRLINGDLPEMIGEPMIDARLFTSVTARSSAAHPTAAQRPRSSRP